MKRRLLVTILAVILILSMLPVTALAEPTPTYNPIEVARIRTFLDSPSAVAGKTNGQQINPSYQTTDDPGTWEGIAWTTFSPTNKQVQNIGLSGSWDNKSLAGFLDVNGFNMLMTVYCSYNQLSMINVSGCSALQFLIVDKNNLSAIDVSNASSLGMLSCNENNLTALTLGTSLQILYCNKNQLSVLDISGNPNLFHIGCENNNLSELNVSSNSALIAIWCGGNNIEQLNLSQNLALESLFCKNNKIKNLDVTNNTKLIQILCSENSMETLLTGNNQFLESLYCDINNLTALDVSGCTILDTLDCANNKLASLELGSLKELIILSCDGNMLDTLDIGDNDKLEFLTCKSNNLANIDTSMNKLLVIFICSSNNINSLNLQENTNLFFLNCRSNNLTTLDLRSNPSLVYLDCSDNPLTKIYANIAGGDFELTGAGNGYLSLAVESALVNGVAAQDIFQNEEFMSEGVYGSVVSSIKAAAVPKDGSAFINWAGTQTPGEPPRLNPVDSSSQAMSLNAESYDALTQEIELTPGYGYTLTANILSLSPPAAEIFVGGRVTLTPDMSGGEWSFDTKALSAQAQGDANIMTGLSPGAARVTYTLRGKSVYSDITVNAVEIPETGQDFSLVYILAGFGLAIIIAALLRKRRTKA